MKNKTIKLNCSTLSRLNELQEVLQVETTKKKTLEFIVNDYVNITQVLKDHKDEKRLKYLQDKLNKVSLKNV